MQCFNIYPFIKSGLTLQRMRRTRATVKQVFFFGQTEMPKHQEYRGLGKRQKETALRLADGGRFALGLIHV